MKTMYGADSDELDRIAQQMLREADTIDNQSRLLAGNLRSIAWLGPIVEEFQSFWNSQLLGSVSTSTTFLREAASSLQRQAQEQRTASAAKYNGGGNGTWDHGDEEFAEGRRVSGSFKTDDPLYKTRKFPLDVTFTLPPQLGGREVTIDWTASDAIEVDDVRQGGIGDCFLMTGLIVIADQNPDLIRDAIVDNGDNTYTVRFFNDEGQPEFVTVTADYPYIENLQENGDWRRGRGPAGRGDGEQWVRVMEKAYGQWTSGSDDLTDIYGKLNKGGGADNVFSALSGQPSTSYDPTSISFDELKQIHDDGGGLSLSSLNSTKDESDSYKVGNDTIHVGHAYWIEHVNLKDGTITIRNPWGYEKDKIVMSYDEFTKAFDRVDSNPL